MEQKDGRRIYSTPRGETSTRKQEIMLPDVYHQVYPVIRIDFGFFGTSPKGTYKLYVELRGMSPAFEYAKICYRRVSQSTT